MRLAAIILLVSIGTAWADDLPKKPDPAVKVQIDKERAEWREKNMVKGPVEEQPKADDTYALTITAQDRLTLQSLNTAFAQCLGLVKLHLSDEMCLQVSQIINNLATRAMGAPVAKKD